MKLKRVRHIILITILGIISSSCVEIFDFESEVKTFESALVIEATITNELKPQKILLSRTFQLDTIGPSPEMNANVKVIDDAQNEYSFHETDLGVYISNLAFSAQPNHSYTLQIITDDGSEYSSFTTELTQHNQIDNLYAERGLNDNGVEGVSIFIDTFDSTGNSKYYRYEYEETYKIIAPLYKPIKLIAVPQPPALPGEDQSPPDFLLVLRDEQVQICYNTVNSNAIIITDSNGLSEDIISRFTIRFINTGNYILSYRYSILVKQYVQSREAHVFYKNLKDFSNFENLFSQVQPGTIIGNVFSKSDEDEKVLGFFEVSSISTKRLFFNFEDFYADEPSRPYVNKCDDFFTPKLVASPIHDAVPPVSPLEQAILEGMQFYDFNVPPFDFDGDLAPYILVRRECGDCTVLGNTEIPNFWVD